MVRKWLKRDIDNRRKEIEKGYLERLRKCASNPKDAKLQADTFSCVSANLISRSLYRRHSNSGIFPCHQILIGVGTETLLKAILVLKNPQEVCSFPNMRFERLKTSVGKILKKENFDKEKRQQILAGLDLIQFKRNLYGHAYTGGIDYGFDNFITLEVLDQLFSYFFPQRRAMIKKIRKFKEIYKMP